MKISHAPGVAGVRSAITPSVISMTPNVFCILGCSENSFLKYFATHAHGITCLFSVGKQKTALLLGQFFVE